MSSVSRGGFGPAWVNPLRIACSGMVCVWLVGCGSAPVAPTSETKVEAKAEPVKVEAVVPVERVQAVIGNGKSAQPTKTKAGEHSDGPAPSKSKGEFGPRIPSKSKGEFGDSAPSKSRGEFGDPAPAKAKPEDEPPAKS
jgi:hypothetical protein